jgi:nitroreductase
MNIEIGKSSENSPKPYDVAILGWWYGKNYGSILTYYGLNRAISKMGYRVLMVHEALGYNGWRISWPNDILSIQFADRIGYNYTQQDHFSKLPHLNSQATTFVVGSDQLWNPAIGRVNDDLFLDFVSEQNKRVAYATSFGNAGTKKFKPEFIERHAQNLQKFSSISVRETYAIDIARDVFGVTATQVVDPVFLLPKDDYSALADKATAHPTGKYVAAFFLDPTPDTKRVAEAIADKLGFQKIVVIPNPDGGRPATKEIFDNDRFEVIDKDSPENFLNTYRNAAYVVTDSFHGTVFSLIFEKPFSSIYNSKRGADRFGNLLDSVGLGSSRRVFEDDSSDDIASNRNVSLQLDYSAVIAAVKKGREASLRWLASALQSPAPRTAAPVEPNVAQERTSMPPLISLPNFVANTPVWKVDVQKNEVNLSVAFGGAVRGNQIWCDLPIPLNKGKAYRLTLKWLLRTEAPTVNIHIRNSNTGKFAVVGSVKAKDYIKNLKELKVDFVAPDNGFNQLMLGAVHFVGTDAGTNISQLSIDEIALSAVVPARKSKPPAEVAMDLALYDNDRFVKSYAQNMASRNIGNARALMMYHSHGVEKGLSHADFRPGFGKIAIPSLAVEMNKWVSTGGKTDDSFFAIAASVMHCYFERHKALAVDVAAFWNLFSAPVQQAIASADDNKGGVLEAGTERDSGLDFVRDRNFQDVVFARRSVREFAERQVSDEDIYRAIHIAKQAPSVCNRQPVRVHVFKTPGTIQKALDLQGGFKGYKLPPMLMLVTSDLSAFVAAVERNQAYIDGGLFAMLLLLALEQVGLGACALNAMLSAERDEAAHKLLNIPSSEVLITFIACGHAKSGILTPRSTRLPEKELLILHNK